MSYIIDESRFSIDVIESLVNKNENFGCTTTFRQYSPIFLGTCLFP